MLMARKANLFALFVVLQVVVDTVSKAIPLPMWPRGEMLATGIKRAISNTSDLRMNEKPASSGRLRNSVTAIFFLTVDKT